MKSVAKTFTSRATAATGATSTSDCCSLEPVLNRYGVPGVTSLDNTTGAKISKKIRRLFTRGPHLKPPPQQARRARLIVGISNPSCIDTVPQALRRREQLQNKSAFVHKRTASQAATAIGVTSTSYCCSLEPVLQRCGAPGVTGLDNTIGANISKTNWRLFTRSPYLN